MCFGPGHVWVHLIRPICGMAYKSRLFSDTFYRLLREAQRLGDYTYFEDDATNDMGTESGPGTSCGRPRVRYTVLALDGIFRRAVREVMDNDETRDYRYWAPFILHGSPFMIWCDEVDENCAGFE